MDVRGTGGGGAFRSVTGGKASRKNPSIPAGTNVIGGALLDSLMGSSQPQQQQPVYYQQQPVYQQQSNQGYTSTSQPKKKIIRKYDSDGNVISEEEVWE